MAKRKWGVGRRGIFAGLGLAAGGFVLLNGVAWMQARAMTTYLPGAVIKTNKPEELSWAEKMWVVATGVRVPRPENERTPESAQLPYDTHRIELETGQHTSEYLEGWYVPAIASDSEMSKGTILLFPPYGASKEALIEQAAIFREMGYDSLLVDFRGAGGSSGADTTLGVREGEDVAHAVRYAEATWPDQPIVLYGASLGASAVMRAAAVEDIDPVAVIVESPFHSLLGTVRRRFHASGLPAFPSAELLVFWGSQYKQIDGFSHNPMDYAQQIDCPVLLFHGAADTRVTQSDADAIFEQLTKDKQMVVYPTVGHGAFAEEFPEAWREEVETFLDESFLEN